LAEWGFKDKGFRKDLAYETLYNKTVYIEFDEVAGLKSYYGRYLAYVYLLNGADFNAVQDLEQKQIQDLSTSGTISGLPSCL